MSSAFCFWRGIRPTDREGIKRFSSALRKKKLGIKVRRNIINTGHSAFVWMRSEGIINKDLPFFPCVRGNDSRVKVALEVEDQTDALSRIPAFSAAQYLFHERICQKHINNIVHKNVQEES